MHDNSYSLIEAMAYQFIEKIKNDPQRNIRNCVDMALNFSDGRFQREFFNSAQDILKNENSSYYRMILEAVHNIDSRKLVTFGMNIGYNSFTHGAEIIRRTEEEKGFDIPWSVTLITNEKNFSENEMNYRKIIAEGKKLGIFTWFVFADKNPQYLMDIILRNPDCAFIIFCESDDITDGFIDEADNMNNIMLCIKYENGIGEIFEKLRLRKMLYSVYVVYDDNTISGFFSDVIVNHAEVFRSLLTIVVPDKNCSDMTKNIVYRHIKKLRIKKNFKTVMWEFCYDSLYIDNVISDGPCAAVIDKNGKISRIYDSDEKSSDCFSQGLENSLKELFPK